MGWGRGSLSSRWASSPKLVDQHARILAVVDRDGNEVNAPGGERALEHGREIARRADPPPPGAIALGVLDEIRVAEGEARVGETVDRLLPADHSVCVVHDDEDDQVEPPADGRLHLL